MHGSGHRYNRHQVHIQLVLVTTLVPCVVAGLRLDYCTLSTYPQALFVNLVKFIIFII